MIDPFEDHCWQHVIPPNVLELYKHYKRDLFIGPRAETIRLMAEIDKVIDEHGGWPGAFQSAK